MVGDFLDISAVVSDLNSMISFSLRYISESESVCGKEKMRMEENFLTAIVSAFGVLT